MSRTVLGFTKTFPKGIGGNFFPGVKVVGAWKYQGTIDLHLMLEILDCVGLSFTYSVCLHGVVIKTVVSLPLPFIT
jgi:hypothetical protein